MRKVYSVSMKTQHTPINEDTDCWQSVLSRDANADGLFVYGVTSTGIYCRPSCPSRKPGRDRVEFFDLPEAAEANGYRSCKRCRPHDIPAIHPEAELIRKACNLIEQADEEMPDLGIIAAHVGLSPHHFQRRFKKLMGITPRQYTEAIKLTRLKNGIREGESLSAAVYGAGFGSSSRVYEKSDQYFGMTPATYARGGQGAEIIYTITDCSLGRIIIGATAKGICFVGLGDNDQELARELASDFPQASRVRDDQALKEMVIPVLDHMEGREPHLDLPVDIRGTAFQWQVWEALREIPMGETRTYKDIALRLGRPKSARAVGRACALNPVSLVVPCHRAVGSDGSLTGYRWGKHRKQQLIKTEKDASLESSSE